MIFYKKIRVYTSCEKEPMEFNPDNFPLDVESGKEVLFGGKPYTIMNDYFTKDKTGIPCRDLVLANEEKSQDMVKYFKTGRKILAKKGLKKPVYEVHNLDGYILSSKRRGGMKNV